MRRAEEVHGTSTHNGSRATTSEPPTAGARAPAPLGPPPGYYEGRPYSESTAPTSNPAGVPGVATAPQNVRISLCAVFFWINAILAWIVWIFSVSAAADQNWIVFDTRNIGVGSNYMRDFCEVPVGELSSVCAAYEFFAACQIFSTIFCSVAVGLYTVAFFRPAEAPHGSAQVLSLVGGIVMGIGAFFQLLAIIFADKTITEGNEYLDYISNTTSDGEISRGPTYGVGIIAILFGTINAIAISVSYRQAGDGFLLKCVKVMYAGAMSSYTGNTGSSVTMPPIPTVPVYTTANA